MTYDRYIRDPKLYSTAAKSNFLSPPHLQMSSCPAGNSGTSSVSLSQPDPTNARESAAHPLSLLLLRKLPRGRSWKSPSSSSIFTAALSIWWFETEPLSVRLRLSVADASTGDGATGPSAGARRIRLPPPLLLLEGESIRVDVEGRFVIFPPEPARWAVLSSPTIAVETCPRASSRPPIPLLERRTSTLPSSAC